MTQDVRAIANLVLELAELDGKKVSNLSINKIVYFLHEAFLLAYERPLVSAKIEAWDHGPVFRELYNQFKQFGRDSIESRATRLNPHTGDREVPEHNLSEADKGFIADRCRELLKLSPGKLVDMSHISGGPWHKARFGNGGVNPGVEITNDLICNFGR
jgi:uncharacterized phage-associated protein